MDEMRARDFLHPRYWPTWFGVGLLWMVSWCPLPLIALFGRALGFVFYVLHAPRRHVVTVNIQRCFPELNSSRQRRIVRQHFYAFGQTLFDIGIGWWASPSRLKRLTRFRGREHFDQAVNAHQNIILLAPHFLGLDIGGIRLSMDHPVVSVFRHPDNRLLAFLMYRARARFGALLVEHNKPFTALVKQTKRGVPLYYLPDQDAGRRQSVFAPFFGIPAATFVVLPRLAAMTNAVVIPCITRQLPWGGGYEIELRPPLKDFPSGDPLVDATRMNLEIQIAVRENPAQYFWLHKRFKTRPEGEPNFYARP